MRHYLLTICCIASLGLSQDAVAQLSIRAAVTPSTVPVGADARYTITVDGNPRSVTGAPDEIQVPGLIVTYAGTPTSRMRTVNNRLMRSVLLHYSVRASREGTYTIPAQKIIVDERELTAPAVRLVATKSTGGSAALDPEVRIELGKTEMFVGEVVPISLVIVAPPGAQFRATDHPTMNTQGFALKRFLPAVLSRANNGKSFDYRYRSSISGIQSGNHTIGPAKLTFNLIVPNTTPPRQPFARRTVTRSFRKETEAVKVSVLPLPTEGKPDHFMGAVGQFSMTVSASPKQLKVNDPLVVDVRIKGRGNFDLLTMPVFSDQSGFQFYEPRKYVENRSNGLQAGTTAFSQVVRPDRLIDALPPLLFAYFDPVAGAYLNLTSEPISLEMEAEATAGTTTVEGKDFSVPAASIPREELGDILTLFHDPGSLRKADGSDARPPVFSWILGTIYVAAAIGVLALGFGRRLMERRRNALADRVRVDHRGPLEILSDLERGGKPAGQFYAAAAECLHSADVDANRPELREILAKADFFQYGASSGKAAEAVNSSEQQHVINALKAVVEKS